MLALSMRKAKSVVRAGSAGFRAGGSERIRPAKSRPCLLSHNSKESSDHSDSEPLARHNSIAGDTILSISLLLRNSKEMFEFES